MVGIFASYSDDPGSKPADVNSFNHVKVFQKLLINEKEAGNCPFKNSKVFHYVVSLL